MEPVAEAAHNSSRPHEAQVAAARELVDKSRRLCAAAGAAGGAGQWAQFLGLLREVVMVGEEQWLQSQLPLDWGVAEALRRIQVGPRLDLAGALEGCDALFADWVALRQQVVRELREAVVAAAEAATAAGV
jgi:hypothetical protein